MPRSQYRLYPIFLIKYAAFFAYEGWVNILFHSITPKGSFRCTSIHISLLNRTNLRQSERVSLTVWNLWPQSHLLLSANFRANKKARKPIFPVLIVVMSVVTGFLTPLCNCRTLVLGVGVKIRSSVPFDFAAHASAHFLPICSLCTLWLPL